ncbi:DNA-directed RNA polymerase subunit alpha C-terminal domain-containing protein [Blastococcus mobilis]|uniref:DNA-directed RNA polymerase subunit alpha C-terminal domain-containing protein n=1 Tax=Blastococcus mobilis TaxID=1938746 RepID=UPI001595A70F|nr:DNA-directed RNA polymerase subunit alpha C-terminal domain-containing protein [Blastococcus mobilis]
MRAGSIGDLGLPGRAVTALTRAGVASIGDLAALTRRDLAAVNGLGPGMIAAIRLVVPEPSTSAGRGEASPGVGHRELARPASDPEPEPAEEESRAAPAIPSFDSLRNPRRHTPVDLLMQGPPAASSVAGPRSTGGARPPEYATGKTRPPEYADLLRLGVRVVRAAAGVPGRVGLWSVLTPARCLRWLLGEQAASRARAGGAAGSARG